MPLKIYIDVESGRKLPLFKEDMVSSVRKAFDFWKKGTDGIISFKEVNKKDADIIIYWGENVGERFLHIGWAGVYNYTNTGLFNISLNGNITLEPVTEPCRMENIAEHEIGHILNLAHTNDWESVMYPGNRCGQIIKDNIKKTLKEIYEIELKPDLSFLSASAIRNRNELNVTFFITNRGLVDSDEPVVSIILDNEEYREKFEYNLKPAYYTYLWRIYYVYDIDKIEIIIDPDNSIDELYENNNYVILEKVNETQIT
ncbi:MAG: matrixin family metalloprotease [Candidatus Aenigmatarchaeota archaeon]